MAHGGAQWGTKEKRKTEIFNIAIARLQTCNIFTDSVCSEGCNKQNNIESKCNAYKQTEKGAEYICV